MCLYRETEMDVFPYTWFPVKGIEKSPRVVVLRIPPGSTNKTPAPGGELITMALFDRVFYIYIVVNVVFKHMEINNGKLMGFETKIL